MTLCVICIIYIHIYVCACMGIICYDKIESSYSSCVVCLGVSKGVPETNSYLYEAFFHFRNEGVYQGGQSPIWRHCRHCAGLSCALFPGWNWDHQCWVFWVCWHCRQGLLVKVIRLLSEKNRPGPGCILFKSSKRIKLKFQLNLSNSDVRYVFGIRMIASFSYSPPSSSDHQAKNFLWSIPGWSPNS